MARDADALGERLLSHLAVLEPETPDLVLDRNQAPAFEVNDLRDGLGGLTQQQSGENQICELGQRAASI